MGQYDDQILEQAKALGPDASPEDVANAVGVSRWTVWSVLDKHGLAKKRIMGSSYVPVEVSSAFTRQHAWVMFKALDRDKAGLSVSDKTRKSLEGFVNGFTTKTWTYNDERGFYSVPRKDSHNDRPFVEEENI